MHEPLTETTDTDYGGTSTVFAGVYEILAVRYGVIEVVRRAA